MPRNSLLDLVDLAGVAVEDEVDVALDRGERRAQLVADGRDELVLHLRDLALGGDVVQCSPRADVVRRAVDDRARAHLHDAVLGLLHQHFAHGPLPARAASDGSSPSSPKISAKGTFLPIAFLSLAPSMLIAEGFTYVTMSSGSKTMSPSPVDARIASSSLALLLALRVVTDADDGAAVAPCRLRRADRRTRSPCSCSGGLDLHVECLDLRPAFLPVNALRTATAISGRPMRLHRPCPTTWQRVRPSMSSAGSFISRTLPLASTTRRPSPALASNALSPLSFRLLLLRSRVPPRPWDGTRDARAPSHLTSSTSRGVHLPSARLSGPRVEVPRKV